MASTVTLKSSELRTGMTVNVHGMRVLIDRPIESRKNEPPRFGPGDHATFWSNGLVINRDDVPNEDVPRSWTSTKFYPNRGLPAEPEGTHRWTIQGNDNARWAVEAENGEPTITEAS